jgi:hypothetical protein
MACPMDGGEENSGRGGIDFTSHNTDYSILVRNNTGESLVAFKGELQSDRLIGGIPAHAQNHGLPKAPALFDKTEDFPLILLTEGQYNANKSNLTSQKNTPFTRVYVFYNYSGDNTAVYEIAGGLGGSNELHIVNSSVTLNIELRLNGVVGETIGYAPAGILDTTLRLNDGNYNIFPVFKRYNTLRDVVQTVYPKASSGDPWFRSVSFGEGTETYTMNLRDLLRGLTMTSGSAWVFVVNQTEAGIRFVEGGIVHKTASGLENVMTERTFQIDMPNVGENYADSKDVANWRFGPVGYEVPLQVSASDTTEKGTFIVERDKMYTITVIGDHNTAAGIHAYISGVTSINTSDFNFAE